MAQMAADEMQVSDFAFVFICEHRRNLWLRILLLSSMEGDWRIDFKSTGRWKKWNRGFRG
jgi:hypothetical protein